MSPLLGPLLSIHPFWTPKTLGSTKISFKKTQNSTHLRPQFGLNSLNQKIPRKCTVQSPRIRPTNHRIIQPYFSHYMNAKMGSSWKLAQTKILNKTPKEKKTGGFLRYKTYCFSLQLLCFTPHFCQGNYSKVPDFHFSKGIHEIYPWQRKMSPFHPFTILSMRKSTKAQNYQNMNTTHWMHTEKRSEQLEFLGEERGGVIK